MSSTLPYFSSHSVLTSSASSRSQSRSVSSAGLNAFLSRTLRVRFCGMLGRYLFDGLSSAHALSGSAAFFQVWCAHGGRWELDRTVGPRELGHQVGARVRIELASCSFQVPKRDQNDMRTTHSPTDIQGDGSLLWPSSRSSASPPPAPPACPVKCLLNVALRSATRPTLICSAQPCKTWSARLSETNDCIHDGTHLATGKLEIVHLLDRSHRILMPLEPAPGE